MHFIQDVSCCKVKVTAMKQGNASARVGLAVKNDLLSRGINTKEAARLLGVTPAGVSVYFSGRPFTAKAARKWSQALDLDEDYLLSGVGQPSKYVTMALSPEEKKLVLAMRRRKGRSFSARDIDALMLDESLSELTNTVKTLRGIVKSPASGKRKTRAFSIKQSLK